MEGFCLWRFCPKGYFVPLETVLAQQGLRYGLYLGIQRDQHLHALSGSILSVQFSKSILELHLKTLHIMEVTYRPKLKHDSFLRNIFKKGAYQL